MKREKLYRWPLVADIVGQAKIIVLISIIFFGFQLSQAQEPNYNSTQGIVVLLDVAHHNVWGTDGFDPVKRFLEDNGFQVRLLEERFNKETLEEVEIVLIAGALSAQNAVPVNQTQEEFDRAWRLPTPSAFTENEIRILAEWVETGGSLLLVSDHMPIAGAIGDLAQTFGIEVSNGFVVDGSALTDLTAQNVAIAGSIVFRRSDETLLRHPVTDGRSEAERIETVGTFVGSAFRFPHNGESLLRLGPNFVSLLPEVAWQFSQNTARESAGDWSQGGLLQVGNGRLGIFGELGVLATPEALARDPDPDNPQKENPQLLLNVLLWLSGIIE